MKRGLKVGAHVVVADEVLLRDGGEGLPGFAGALRELGSYDLVGGGLDRVAGLADGEVHRRVGEAPRSFDLRFTCEGAGDDGEVERQLVEYDDIGRSDVTNICDK